MQIYHFLQIDTYFDQIMSCGSRLVCIFTIDHVRMTEYSAKPRPSKKVATSTSGKTMLACISMHNLIQIYCAVQELLTALFMDGRTIWTHSNIDAYENSLR